MDTIHTTAEDALARAKAFERAYVDGDWHGWLPESWIADIRQEHLIDARAAYRDSPSVVQLVRLFAVAYHFHLSTGNPFLSSERQADVALIAAHAEVLAIREHIENEEERPGHGH